MAETPPITALSDAVIGENYAPGAVERGRGYADDGRVRIISVEAGRLTGVVAGSGRNTYLVNVAWRPLGGGIVVDDNCSCPLGGFCKHAVASILVARREATATADEPRPTGSWRRLLDGIVESNTDTTEGPSPLALQFTVQTPRPSHYAPDPSPRVAIRPMRKGKRGQWIKTGASWRDLHYESGSSGLIAEHVAALRALWNASPRHSYYPDTGPITLATFGPELWIHLRNVVESGIALIDDDGTSTVLLRDERARVDIDLVSAPGGAVSLSTLLRVGDEPVDTQVGVVGFIGVPAHGLFSATAGRLELIRLERVLSPALAGLIDAPPVIVPATDVDELLDVYQPHLAQRAHLVSSDGSVQISTNRFDGLAVFIGRDTVDTATLDWAVRYVRNGTVRHFALDDNASQLRDRRAEADTVAGVTVPPELRGLLATDNGTPRSATLRGGDTVRLFTTAVPWLEAHDIEVIVTDGSAGPMPALREATADPLVSLQVTDSDAPDGRTDWFDLSVSVSVDGEAIPFVALFRALNANESVLILPSGTWLSLERPELERLRTLINEARGLVDTADDDATVQINRFQASWFDELAALGVVEAQSNRWAESVRRMGTLAAPEPVNPPSTLKAELRPYQLEGLAWLRFVESNDLGGILADDMGLGKTVQILSLFLSVLAERPDARFLVVAPTSVVENWHREAERFAPTMAVRTITETVKRRGTPLVDVIDEASLVVTSYTLFRLEYDDYAAHRWDVLCLDEAQVVKNHQGKTYRAVRELPARVKIAITGTPLENSLMDLWSLLSITAPGLYPDPERFSSVYRKPIEKGDAPALLATLRRRIAPLMRRRTKAEVLTELPPKIEQVVDIELSPKHRRLYQTRLQRERAKVLGLVGDIDRNRFTIFSSLTLLRQLSLDPGLIDEGDDHVGSAKLDRLVDDVTQIVAEGHRALIFSQFTRFLRRAEERLAHAGVDAAYLDGRTRRRAEVIDAFKSGDVPVFLISLKAGGVGLNLAEADYCFILDPWWNPATETQAVDRAHRIGQTNPVMVYRYVATDTIEEKVMELKARKAALFADVVDAGGALSGTLSAEDIRGLFDAG